MNVCEELSWVLIGEWSWTTEQVNAIMGTLALLACCAFYVSVVVLAEGARAVRWIRGRRT